MYNNIKYFIVYLFVLISASIIALLPRKKKAIMWLVGWARKRQLIWAEHFNLSTELTPINRLICWHRHLPQIAVGCADSAYDKFRMVKIGNMKFVECGPTECSVVSNVVKGNSVNSSEEIIFSSFIVGGCIILGIAVVVLAIVFK